MKFQMEILLLRYVALEWLCVLTRAGKQWVSMTLHLPNGLDESSNRRLWLPPIFSCTSTLIQQPKLNFQALKVAQTTRHVLPKSSSTRERVFGMPYDPQRDMEMSSTREDIIQDHLQHNLDSMESRTLREYASQRCCQVACYCSLEQDCKCRKKWISTGEDECPYYKKEFSCN